MKLKNILIFTVFLTAVDFSNITASQAKSENKAQQEDAPKNPRKRALSEFKDTRESTFKTRAKGFSWLAAGVASTLGTYILWRWPSGFTEVAESKKVKFGLWICDTLKHFGFFKEELKDVSSENNTKLQDSVRFGCRGASILTGLFAPFCFYKGGKILYDSYVNDVGDVYESY